MTPRQTIESPFSPLSFLFPLVDSPDNRKKLPFASHFLNQVNVSNPSPSLLFWRRNSLVLGFLIILPVAQLSITVRNFESLVFTLLSPFYPSSIPLSAFYFPPSFSFQTLDGADNSI